MKQLIPFIISCSLLVVLSACQSTVQVTPSLVQPTITETIQPTEPSQTRAPVNRSPEFTETVPVVAVETTPSRLVPSLTSSPTNAQLVEVSPEWNPDLSPDGWQNLPVIPVVKSSVREIYQRGLTLGNNPHAFSKIGDCGSTPAWFLGDFDRGTRYYSLGPYQALETVIQEFPGSFSRTSLAARSGFNASSVFAVIWSDRSQCAAGEAPIACEYRLHRPVIAFITLGTNDIWHKDTFETQMRKIIEYSMDMGVIPILSTKADNAEGDGSINATISRLAVEYGVPLWNYWAAVQALPEHGLQADQAHLTWGPNRFDDPKNLQRAWPVRNLTALQVLLAVMQAIK